MYLGYTGHHMFLSGYHIVSRLYFMFPLFLGERLWETHTLLFQMLPTLLCGKTKSSYQVNRDTKHLSELFDP